MTQIVHTRLSKKDMEHLEDLVRKGYYTNLSDAVRQAVRNLLTNHSTSVGLIKGEGHWESALEEAEGHLELALEIFHKKLEKK